MTNDKKNKTFPLSVGFLILYGLAVSLIAILLLIANSFAIEKLDQQDITITELNATIATDTLIINHLKAIIIKNSFHIPPFDSVNYNDTTLAREKGDYTIHTKDIENGASRGGSGL